MWTAKDKSHTEDKAGHLLFARTFENKLLVRVSKNKAAYISSLAYTTPTIPPKELPTSISSAAVINLVD